MEQGYRGPQVCSIVGITYRQLDYWARTNLLRPSITEARGSGTQRRYNRRDLLELKVIKRMLDSGLSLQQVRRAVTWMRDHPSAYEPDAMLVLAGLHHALAWDGNDILALLREAPTVTWIVAIDAIADELDEALDVLAA